MERLFADGKEGRAHKNENKQIFDKLNTLNKNDLLKIQFMCINAQSHTAKNSNKVICDEQFWRTSGGQFGDGRVPLDHVTIKIKTAGDGETTATQNINSIELYKFVSKENGETLHSIKRFKFIFFESEENEAKEVPGSGEKEDYPDGELELIFNHGELLNANFEFYDN